MRGKSKSKGPEAGTSLAMEEEHGGKEINVAGREQS